MTDYDLTPLFVKDYEQPENHKALLTWLLDGFGWGETSGSIPGVWASRPIGNRCLWSASWASSRGLIHPDMYAPLEALSIPALLAEATDRIYRFQDIVSWKLAKLCLEYYTGEPANPDWWRKCVTDLLYSSRQSPPEYTLSWSPPGDLQLIRNLPRAGWVVERMVVNA